MRELSVLRVRVLVCSKFRITNIGFEYIHGIIDISSDDIRLIMV